MVAHVYNPTAWEAEAGELQFEASLGNLLRLSQNLKKLGYSSE